MSDFSLKNPSSIIDDITPIFLIFCLSLFAIEKMFFHKSVLTLLAVCLSTTVCLGEEPSFPQAVEGVEYLKDQYIVQYKGTHSFEEAKRSMSRERNEEVNLVRNIDSLNIGVYKFSDEKAAAKWRESTAGIKYFERGKKNT